MNRYQCSDNSNSDCHKLFPIPSCNCERCRSCNPWCPVPKSGCQIDGDQKQDLEQAQAQAQDQDLVQAQAQDQDQDLAQAQAQDQDLAQAQAQDQDLVQAQAQDQDQDLAQAQAQDQDQDLAQAQAQDQDLAQAQAQDQDLGQAQAQDQDLGQAQAQDQDQGLAQAQAQDQDLGQAQAQDQDQGLAQAQAQDQDLGQAQAQDQDQGLAQAQAQDQDLGQAQAQDQDLAQAQAQDQDLGQAQAQDQDLAQAQAQDQDLGQAQAQDQDLAQAQAEDQDQAQGQLQALGDQNLTNAPSISAPVCVGGGSVNLAVGCCDDKKKYRDSCKKTISMLLNTIKALQNTLNDSALTKMNFYAFGLVDSPVLANLVDVYDGCFFTILPDGETNNVSLAMGTLDAIKINSVSTTPNLFTLLLSYVQSLLTSCCCKDDEHDYNDCLSYIRRQLYAYKIANAEVQIDIYNDNITGYVYGICDGIVYLVNNLSLPTEISAIPLYKIIGYQLA